jgi:hypothetical protein
MTTLCKTILVSLGAAAVVQTAQGQPSYEFNNYLGVGFMEGGLNGNTISLNNAEVGAQTNTLSGVTNTGAVRYLDLVSLMILHMGSVDDPFTVCNHGPLYYN